MPKGLNWEEAHARLERTSRAIEGGEAVSPGDATRILRKRAQALARPLVQAEAASEMLDLLVFSLTDARYAVEMGGVAEVTPLRELTPVPCTPPFVRGVMNHRGRILAVLDLGKLFELPGQAIKQDSFIVAVEAGGLSFGILTDMVVGTVQYAASDLSPPPAALPAARRIFLKGVTAEMVAVLDLEALARDPRLIVNEEIG
jgi:purine-binding chemotaxis protein CheW